MLALLLALVQAGALHPSPPPASAPYAPRTATVAEFEAAFPSTRRLARADRAGQALPNARFEQRVQRLAREPLRAADPVGGRPAVALGDLLRRAREAARPVGLGGAVDAAREQLGALLVEAQALTPADLWPDVRELLDVRDFVSPKWDPDDEDERDGFLVGPEWTLPADCWTAHGGERVVVQATTFIAADLAVIKECEANFPCYFDFPANRYLKAQPVPHSYLTLESASAGAARARATVMQVDFESDLPFPFGTYALRLSMLNVLDAEDRLIAYVTAESKDLHWLAGYDLFEPVFDGAGEFVGTLVTRQLGMDIDGVPDQPSHRLAGVRTVLGGLRRNAEAQYDARPAGATTFAPLGAVPLAPVRAAAD